MELKIIRTYLTNGTNGELLLDGERICSMIELPWKQNKPTVSCIPEGRYELMKRYTPRFGKHFMLLNVPERNLILIHAANDAMKELEGCIASVTRITGEGEEAEARMALAKIVSVVYPAFDKGDKVFVEIMRGE